MNAHPAPIPIASGRNANTKCRNAIRIIQSSSNLCRTPTVSYRLLPSPTVPYRPLPSPTYAPPVDLPPVSHHMVIIELRDGETGVIGHDLDPVADLQLAQRPARAAHHAVLLGQRRHVQRVMAADVAERRRQVEVGRSRVIRERQRAGIDHEVIS